MLTRKGRHFRIVPVIRILGSRSLPRGNPFFRLIFRRTIFHTFINSILQQTTSGLNNDPQMSLTPLTVHIPPIHLPRTLPRPLLHHHLPALNRHHTHLPLSRPRRHLHPSPEIRPHRYDNSKQNQRPRRNRLQHGIPPKLENPPLHATGEARTSRPRPHHLRADACRVAGLSGERVGQDVDEEL
jgi:hypothetical protein